MKKVLSAILCLIMLVSACLSFAGCGEKYDEDYTGPIIPVYFSEIPTTFDPQLAYLDNTALPVLNLMYEGLYKYDAKGFLQWGHNFWFTQYSKKAINPYEVTDAGNAFPSGDAFVVYPGEDGKPLNSLRHLVFHDGFQDMRALRLLEELTSREYVLSFIEKDLYNPLTFRTYPHEANWLLGLRYLINEEIAKNI